MDTRIQWQDICQAIQEGLFLVSPDGVILEANEALARLTGYSRRELEGADCAVLGCDACEAERKSAGGAWCRLFATRQSAPKRCVVRRKDGSLAPVFKNQALLRDSLGAVVGAVETLLDLTEIDRLDRRVEELSRMLDRPGTFHGMVGQSPPMLRLYDMLEKTAKSDAPILLTGESGTGKELAARALHDLGPRKDGPYVQLNCAALNESLLESELFGHARGAFTGAVRQRQGRFEAAHGGDLFLDEIGDAPAAIQVKLLRVLETRTVERVGDHRPVPVDVRLIAATNQDLPRLIAQGSFRQDFFFRVNVIPIVLPPLRERMEDLPPLVEHFVGLLAAKTGKDVTGLTPEAMGLLMRHSWPGNVRELKSALEYAFVLAESGPIGPRLLPPLGAPAPETPPIPATRDDPQERRTLLAALDQAGGNKSQAARILGVSRLTVQNRMRKYRISCDRVLRS